MKEYRGYIIKAERDSKGKFYGIYDSEGHIWGFASDYDMAEIIIDRKTGKKRRS